MTIAFSAYVGCCLFDEAIVSPCVNVPFRYIHNDPYVYDDMCYARLSHSSLLLFVSAEGKKAQVKNLI